MGTNTAAYGQNAKATAEGAIAVGAYNKANQRFATAIGAEANASNDTALAVGRDAKASGEFTISIGANSNATKQALKLSAQVQQQPATTRWPSGKGRSHGQQINCDRQSLNTRALQQCRLVTKHSTDTAASLSVISAISSDQASIAVGNHALQHQQCRCSG